MKPKQTNETEFANQDEEISKGMDYKWMWEQLREFIEEKYYENRNWYESTRAVLKNLFFDSFIMAESVQSKAEDLKVAQSQMETYSLIEDMFVNLEHDAKISAEAKKGEEK